MNAHHAPGMPARIFGEADGEANKRGRPSRTLSGVVITFMRVLQGEGEKDTSMQRTGQFGGGRRDEGALPSRCQRSQASVVLFESRTAIEVAPNSPLCGDTNRDRLATTGNGHHHGMTPHRINCGETAHRQVPRN